jgi:hypothetical protein
MMLEYGSFAPDRPPTAQHIVGGGNVYAMSDGSFCPGKTFSPTYNALAARCQGAFYSIDSVGNTALWAGTATKLYKLSAGVSFSDVSRVAPYGLVATENWEFCQFGQRVFATNITDSLQSFLLNSSSIFADVSGAPKAKHMAVVSNFLMLGNTNDGTYGLQPDGLWWSAIADGTSWPTAGSSAAAAVQSGRVNISGAGGAVQRIVPRVGSIDAIVIQERQISRCTYIGTPDVFAFQPMDGARGTPSPQSVARYGGNIYYLGEDGFYVCDGSQSLPIGAGFVDDFFYEDVNPAYMDRVIGEIDPVYKIYIIAYPSIASTTGVIDKLLTYNYVSQKWAPPISCSIETLCRLGSIGYSLESLDAFGTMDTITTSLDSRAWMGNGRPSLAAFDSTHKAGFFSGANLEATLETGDLDLEGKRYMVNAMRPMITGVGATVSCATGTRDSMNSNVTYGAYRGLNRENKVPCRTNSRYFRNLIKVSADGPCEHIQGVYLDLLELSNL